MPARTKLTAPAGARAAVVASRSGANKPPITMTLLGYAVYNNRAA
jgi:hypothetical protein